MASPQELAASKLKIEAFVTHLQTNNIADPRILSHQQLRLVTPALAMLSSAQWNATKDHIVVTHLNMQNYPAPSNAVDPRKTISLSFVLRAMNMFAAVFLSTTCGVKKPPGQHTESNNLYKVSIMLGELDSIVDFKNSNSPLKNNDGIIPALPTLAGSRTPLTFSSWGRSYHYKDSRTFFESPSEFHTVLKDMNNGFFSSFETEKTRSYRLFAYFQQGRITDAVMIQVSAMIKSRRLRLFFLFQDGVLTIVLTNVICISHSDA